MWRPARMVGSSSTCRPRRRWDSSPRPQPTGRRRPLVARLQRGSTTRSAPSGVPLAIRHHRPVVAAPGQRAPLPALNIERTRVNSRTITQTNQISPVRMDGPHGEKSRRIGELGEPHRSSWTFRSRVTTNSGLCLFDCLRNSIDLPGSETMVRLLPTPKARLPPEIDAALALEMAPSASKWPHGDCLLRRSPLVAQMIVLAVTANAKVG